LKSGIRHPNGSRHICENSAHIFGQWQPFPSISGAYLEKRKRRKVGGNAKPKPDCRAFSFFSVFHANGKKISQYRHSAQRQQGGLTPSPHKEKDACAQRERQAKYSHAKKVHRQEGRKK